ncbi:copper oxidase [Brachybacterium vulturis]|uniref:Copper oxidase n=1 Tax=Brachybacterium vulturis TaxID=2017484 RepID=A0A291GRE1_9MICO|nr:multicopper oxidase domain-containing protein [Brachybacterium vulturis]ATG52680.1 copper oxidase [Brachybacterium vulturis]
MTLSPSPAPSASGPRRPGRSGNSPAMDRGAWHRKASRPVQWWMLALIVVVLTHQWIPQSRWLMVHMVTLGLITTSIMVWGQHFAEALLKTRLGEESRPWQVRRILLLSAGVLVTILGMLPSWPWVVVLGALMVSAALVWYAISLGSQVRAALAPRFEFTVKAYIAAACLIPVGATLGAVMAFSPGEPWQGRLLLAHQLVNILGFVGVTVTGTLLTLWPTVLRTRIDLPAAKRAAHGLLGMLVSVLGATAGALLGSALLGCAFLIVYLGSFAWVAITLVKLGLNSARQERKVPLPLFPILSITSGVAWFALAVVGLLAMWWRSADEHLGTALVAADLQQLTVPFVAGFLLQVLFGAMSYLLPVTMRGGPRSTTAAHAAMSRFAVLRVVTYNLALALLVLAGFAGTGASALFSALSLGTTDIASFGSLSRVALSVLAFLVLLSFPVLLVIAIRASIRHRRTDLPMPSGPGAGPGTSLPVGPPAGAAARSAPTAAAPAAATGVTGTSGATGGPAARDRPAMRPGGMDRRALTSVLLGLGTVLGVTALGSALDRAQGSLPPDAGFGGHDPGAGPVAPTGRTTTIAVSMAGMRFHPDVLEVPAGDSLVIELRNDDPHDVHDLVLASGVSSGRLQPGAGTTVEAGVISHDLEGWCSIVGHRAMGMVLSLVATGADGTAAGTAPATGAGGVEELARVPLDLQAEPGNGHQVRDARLPAASGPDQRVRFEITDEAAEIAPGVVMDAMTYNGTVMGPILRSELGARLTVELFNAGAMGHSLDLHAGRVAPDEVMATIPPGDSLEYPITTDHAGIWLYHCATMPMSVHLAAGMAGALIVPPAGLAAVDREYVLVQSEHYLVPAGAPGSEATMHAGAHPVSPAKIAAERPDATVFNGHANQYVHSPLEARVGERVRLWVLAAGPSRGISFHVVGGVFDTVFKEGEYLLRPENENGGGAQALDLAAAQGGFVELVFDEPGTYTAVNHSFVDLERGARALIRVSR